MLEISEFFSLVCMYLCTYIHMHLFTFLLAPPLVKLIYLTLLCSCLQAFSLSHPTQKEFLCQNQHCEFYSQNKVPESPFVELTLEILIDRFKKEEFRLKQVHRRAIMMMRVVESIFCVKIKCSDSLTKHRSQRGDANVLYKYTREKVKLFNVKEMLLQAQTQTAKGIN